MSGRSATFSETTVDPAHGVSTQIVPDVRAVVDGLDDADLAAVASDAGASCPVAKALTGTELVLNTRFVSDARRTPLSRPPHPADAS